VQQLNYVLDFYFSGFTNDSVEHVPDVLKLKNERASKLYKSESACHVKKLLNKMDELNIRDITTSDWVGVGIDLKIYVKSNGVVQTSGATGAAVITETNAAAQFAAKASEYLK